MIHIMVITYGDIIRPPITAIIGDSQHLHEILLSGLSAAATWGVIRCVDRRRQRAFDRASFLQGRIVEHLNLKAQSRNPTRTDP